MPLPQQQPGVTPNGRPVPGAPIPTAAPTQVQAPPIGQADTMIHSVAPELPGIHPGNPLYQTATINPINRRKAPIMAKEKSKREVLREKIAARKAERKVEESTKYARLRRIAAEEPKEVDAALTEVTEALGVMVEGLTNLRENLDLIDAPKTASIKARVAAARKFASNFRQTANDTPEVLVDAVGEIYNSLDEIAAGLENLAENLGFEIPGGSPVMDEFTEEGESEIAGEQEGLDWYQNEKGKTSAEEGGHGEPPANEPAPCEDEDQVRETEEESFETGEPASMQQIIREVMSSGLWEGSGSTYFTHEGCDYCSPGEGNDVENVEGFRNLEEAQKGDEHKIDFKLCGTCLNDLYYGGID